MKGEKREGALTQGASHDEYFKLSGLPWSRRSTGEGAKDSISPGAEYAEKRQRNTKCIDRFDGIGAEGNADGEMEEMVFMVQAPNISPRLISWRCRAM